MRLVAPAVMIPATSLLTTRSCGGISQVRLAGSHVPLRPPSWVFGVVWPILYITTGIAWQRAYRQQGGKWDREFLAIIGLCCSWLVFYTCLRWQLTAGIVLLVTAVLAWRLQRALQPAASKFLTPLAVWVSFATYLNFAGLRTAR